MEEQTGLNVGEKLYEFICLNFPKARQKPLELTDSLIDSGVVDSLGLLTIVDFIESEFDITVSDMDVGENNFGSMEKIIEYVKRSLSRPS